ncbi:MAG: hypothetical protein ACKVUS_00210 [Saprospiraceae bacterium]
MALLSLLSFASCKNTPSAPQLPSRAADLAASKPVPDAGDLLRILQGRWQSEQDASYILEITDTRMRHFNGGKLSAESKIEMDGACQSPVCKADSVDTSDGWCFSETPLEQSGTDAAQCNFVVMCDTALLQYRALGAAGGGLAFKKIQ